MAIVSIGDLAQGYMLRLQNVELKSRMGTLVEELASGRTADVARHLSGSYSYLSDIERNLTILEGYEVATNEAIVFTDGMQAALEQFQTTVSDLGISALSAANAKVSEVISNLSDRAVGDMSAMVNALNKEVAGRALFSGVTPDQPPLISAEAMLDELRTLVAGETTLAGIDTILDDWFESAGGGYETIAYQGATTSMQAFRLGAGEAIDLDLRADDPSLRVLLKHTAMAALASDDALGFDPALQEEMVMAAGQGLTLEQEGLVRVRADLGYAQQRTAEASTRISAERTSFLMARTELLEVDAYEAAMQLEDVQYQLEALYNVTVKLSRLSLMDYL